MGEQNKTKIIRQKTKNGDQKRKGGKINNIKNIQLVLLSSQDKDGNKVSLLVFNVQQYEVVLVIYCCVTNYPKIQQFETTNIYYLSVSAGQEMGSSLAGWFWLMDSSCSRAVGNDGGLIKA